MKKEIKLIRHAILSGCAIIMQDVVDSDPLEYCLNLRLMSELMTQWEMKELLFRRDDILHRIHIKELKDSIQYLKERLK